MGLALTYKRKTDKCMRDCEIEKCAVKQRIRRQEST